MLGGTAVMQRWGAAGVWDLLTSVARQWREHLRDARSFYASLDIHESVDLLRGLVPAMREFAASIPLEPATARFRSFWPGRWRSNKPVNEARSLLVFRYGILIAAVVLGGEAAWTLAAELMRPPRPTFPAALLAAATAEHDRDAAAAAEAGAAARFAGLRGDLWADDAVLLAAGRLNEGSGIRSAATLRDLGAARDAAVRAVQLAPHDSRIWLLIAAIDAARYGRDRRVAAPLKMSYYTGLFDPALMPLRLRIATRSDAIMDDGLQLLVSADLRAIIKTRPDLKPAITAAYRSATAQGRIFLVDAVYDLDPQLIASIQRVSAARSR
jgi:hypothetical protein